MFSAVFYSCLLLYHVSYCVLVQCEGAGASGTSEAVEACFWTGDKAAAAVEAGTGVRVPRLHCCALLVAAPNRALCYLEGWAQPSAVPSGGSGIAPCANHGLCCGVVQSGMSVGSRCVYRYYVSGSLPVLLSLGWALSPGRWCGWAVWEDMKDGRPGGREQKEEDRTRPGGQWSWWRHETGG